MNKPTKEQQEFVAFLKKKYGNTLNEKKLQQLKDSGQLEKDIEEFKNSKKTQAKKAAHGAKLDYLKAISHKCPDGQELYYFKVGGRVDCGCKGKKMEEGGKAEETGVQRIVRKVKDKIEKKKQNLQNKPLTEEERKKAQEWSKEYKRTMKASGIGNRDWVEGDKCGGKVKKHQTGGIMLTSKYNFRPTTIQQIQSPKIPFTSPFQK